MNLEPNTTTVSGTCAVNSSELTLVSGTMKIVFAFANVSPNQTSCHFFTQNTFFLTSPIGVG